MSYLQAYANIGRRLYIDVAHELSINTLENEAGHRCNPAMSNEYDKVFYNKVATENDMKYGCTVPFHPQIISEITKTQIEICRNVSSAERAYANYLVSKSASVLSPEDVPCAGFHIFPGLPLDSIEANYTKAYIRLYIKHEIKIKSIIIYYDSHTFAAEIGGYVGMFLGVSMVDLSILLCSGIKKLVHYRFKLIPLKQFRF